MFKITQTVVRYSKAGGVQSFLRFNNLTSAPITAPVRNIDSEVSEFSESKKPPEQRPKSQKSLIATAFAALKSDQSSSDIQTPFTDSQIASATTVDQLLSISQGAGVSRRHALKVVSVLADWSTSGKVQLADFETDPRFIRLCKVLTKSTNYVKKNYVTIRSEDLSTIIDVTADDEAAKLITSISLPQMVRVMSSLSQKKRRSTPLLRSLAFNITRNPEQLDMKQSADLLYSAAVLNFIDENLLEKVCSDVCEALKGNAKGSAAVGSILTSLGILRYKDPGTLDALSKWVLKNSTTCRPLDMFSLFITLATLNHQPCNAAEVYKVLVPQLNMSEANKPSVWLDFVWSLLVLNQAKSEHIESVLSDDFIEKVSGSNGAKLKLLNIDSACTLLEDYSGPRLPADSPVRNTVATRSRDKEVLVSAVQDSLSGFLTPQTHFQTNIDTKMGFYIDAELLLDRKGDPLPLSQPHPEGTKVAVITYDYHDTCIGRIEASGLSALCSRLLEARGYRTLPVMHSEFSPRDKLVTRVCYLQNKIKGLAN